MNKPFWWPDPQSFIAVILVTAMVALMFVMCFHAVPDGDAFKMMLGGFVTVGFSSIISFYFGSSRGSAAKDDTINKIASDAGYMMVFDKSGMTANGMPSILFSQNAMDVTDDVLKVLNRNAPKTQP